MSISEKLGVTECATLSSFITSIFTAFTSQEYDTHPYWLDNVYLEKVEATLAPAQDSSRLFINPSNTEKIFNLGNSVWLDKDGNTVSSSLTVPAWQSVILAYISGEYTSVPESTSVNNDIIMYPNPVLDVLNIKINNSFDNEYIIEIYNYTGQILYNDNFKTDEFSINLNNLKKGFYIVKITGKSRKKIFTKTIIK